MIETGTAGVATRRLRDGLKISHKGWGQEEVAKALIPVFAPSPNLFCLLFFAPIPVFIATPIYAEAMPELTLRQLRPVI
jgi:hypothetical protein